MVAPVSASNAKEAKEGWGVRGGWPRRRGPCPALEPCPTLSGGQTPPGGDMKEDSSQHVSSATCHEDCWGLWGAQQPHVGRSEQPLFTHEENKEQEKWPEAQEVDAKRGFHGWWGELKHEDRYPWAGSPSHAPAALSASRRLTEVLFDCK